MDLELCWCGRAEQREEGQGMLLAISEAQERAMWSCLVTRRGTAMTTQGTWRLREEQRDCRCLQAEEDLEFRGWHLSQ